MEREACSGPLEPDLDHSSGGKWSRIIHSCAQALLNVGSAHFPSEMGGSLFIYRGMLSQLAAAIIEKYKRRR